ncbi:MAG: bifunctional dihydroorotate dehydrogenase B NAD binding subunit/NADPH-dependent glutamate synthase, partial [Muribaculaceae bacterium]|nr:bifunctional dihydroorotate dehydrogenase B NAD binding subunit/NADPH-dependent glutamate synthase [Muribaculaceae bacterium]
MSKELTDRDAAWRVALRDEMKAAERTAIPRVQMLELSPAYRITVNEEVAQGLTLEMALQESTRCLDCPDPGCVKGCPVNINIPSFIKTLPRGHTDDALRVLKMTSALPA